MLSAGFRNRMRTLVSEPVYLEQRNSERQEEDVVLGRGREKGTAVQGQSVGSVR